MEKMLRATVQILSSHNYERSSGLSEVEENLKVKEFYNKTKNAHPRSETIFYNSQVSVKLRAF